MYDVVTQTPKEVFLIYIVFASACIITYPLIRLIVNVTEKGLEKWR